MSCTTLLAGRKATYDGSTMIARNDDSAAGRYTPKKLIVVTPDQQPRIYQSVIGHLTIELPDEPMRYSAVPNVLPDEGIWAGAGINAANVAMTATETIASNERVLGADPLVVYKPADGEIPEQAGGIGEEDLVTIVLPYIRSAREGVLRTAALLEKYGTYEMNGMAFADVNEIWWMETLGGHHWIARRVPDDQYVVVPNESGIDSFDLDDAFGKQAEHMCSADLREFIADNHLDLSMDGDAGIFNPRVAFGTQSDADHVYNTPRAWSILRYFNSMKPERKITVEDFKYTLSNHFQGTPYDPYNVCGNLSMSGAYRCIGVNRTDFLAILQIRPYMPEQFRSVEWLTFGSNVFNTVVPFYTNTKKVPTYLSYTEKDVDTDSFYWSCRLVAALADAQHKACKIHIERYQIKVMAEAHRILGDADKLAAELLDMKADPRVVIDSANQELADMLKRETDDVLGKVLIETSNLMKNAYARSDA